MSKPEKWYSVVGPEPFRPPDYERVVRRLSDEELAAELAAGRGDEGYREAARAEMARREKEDA